MKAPKVDESFSAVDARQNLQRALDHLAEIYTIIGDVPYAAATEDPNWHPLMRKYDDAKSNLMDLATDPIPF